MSRMPSVSVGVGVGLVLSNPVDRRHPWTARVHLGKKA